MLILLIKVQRILNDRMSHLAYTIHGMKSHILTKSNSLFNFLVYVKYLGVGKKRKKEKMMMKVSMSSAISQMTLLLFIYIYI